MMTITEARKEVTRLRYLTIEDTVRQTTIMMEIKNKAKPSKTMLDEGIRLTRQLIKNEKKLYKAEGELKYLIHRKHMPLGTHEFGKFTVKSGTLTLTDPCYTVNTWCMIKEIKVKNGEWIAKSSVNGDDEENWGRRISELIAIHSDHKLSKAPWKPYEGKGSIGVDSGQAGIFDAKEYSKLNTGRLDKLFYKKCCDATLNLAQRDIIDDWGAVSSSGYGDGRYSVFTKTVKSKIIGVKIVFISNNEEQEEEEE